MGRKNILVFNVAAEHSGALTVLEEFYERAINDKINNWHFILSFPEFKETENVKISNYKWVKKNWFYRIFFDYIFSYFLIRKYNPDKILSLQNIKIPYKTNIQTVYIQQSLPFAEERFSFLEHRLLWFYQTIYSLLIKNSILKVNHILVQTKWMKDVIVTKYNIDKKKISILPMSHNIKIKNKYKKPDKIKFSYPANAAIYKNHKIIVEAVKNISSNNYDNFEVVFTISGNENKHIIELYDLVINLNLPIKFEGQMVKDKVFNLYENSILIFPSKVETIGLPLLEARKHNTPILAADLLYARETLNNYENISYFDPNDSRELKYLIEKEL